MKKITAVFLFLAVVTIGCFTACAETDKNEGYMTNNNICTQDEYEQTLFGQPISVERNGEMRLGIKSDSQSPQKALLSNKSAFLCV